MGNKIAELIRKLVKAFNDALNADSTDKDEVARLRAENKALADQLTSEHSGDAEVAAAMQEAQSALDAATAAQTPTEEAVKDVSDTTPA